MFFPLLNNIFYYPYSFYGYKIYRYYNNGPFNFEYIKENNYDRNKTQEVFDISNFQIIKTEYNKLEDMNLLDNSSSNIENNDRLNIFGFDLNVDDLVIIFVILTLFREESIDYSIIIALFIILFDRG